MKNKQYVILAISALAAGSMSLTTFATPADSQDIAVTASIAGYNMMGGLNDIQLSVAADADDLGHFKGSATEEFCVVATADNAEVRADHPEVVSPTIGSGSARQQIQFIENGVYQLDVTANKMTRDGGNYANSLKILDYVVSIDDIAGSDSYQVSSNNNNLTCSDNNHTLKIMVDDSDVNQQTGTYVGSVTVAVSGHVAS